MTIALPAPDLQVSFAYTLKRLRGLCLQDALLATIRKLDIPQIDRQLAYTASSADLAALANHGLRGELLFAVPYVLEANPWLLAYYRLLLGFSQKEFYGKVFGVSHFKGMETAGKVSDRCRNELPELCKSLSHCGSKLLRGLGSMRISRDLLDDLTLLTVGPQLRGGANNRLGAQGIVQVFDIIREIVAHAGPEVTDTSIHVKSAAGRTFSVQFAPDPDIIVREEMALGEYRNVVAIEVKAGTDVSNIHNRIGEAEKSHQKARRRGFTECWTMTNVAKLDLAKAKSESPSTDRFYSLVNLATRSGSEYQDFQRRIISLIGIAAEQV